MEATLIPLVCAAGIALLVIGAFLLARDVVWGRVGAGVMLNRLPLASQEQRPSGPLSQLDYAFQRLIIDSDVTTPITGLLLMIAVGTGLGGLLLIALQSPFAAASGFAIGMLAPLPYFAYRRHQRLANARAQLPGVLDLLARAVRAGASLDQAIELLGRKAPEPLGKEFRRCAHQLQMGLALQGAMRALAFRVRTVEMQILATTLSVHRTSGGNLAETLERMARVIRERQTYRRQLRATTAAGRFSAMLVSIAGVFLFAYMFVFQQEYVGKLFSSPFGQSMLLAAVVLEVFGLVWIWKMLKSDL